jgi:hypothetical protein
MTNRIKLIAVFLLAPLALPPVLAGQSREAAFGFTLDFEKGGLLGWTPSGNAFNSQPTLGNNTLARGAGDAALQGKYWIGTYEQYQGLPGQNVGNVQGDMPTGTLTSSRFAIPNTSMSFLVGGGSAFETRVELILVEGDPIEGMEVEKRVLYVSGENTETMKRKVWDLTPYAGKTGRIRIVDDSRGEWGHINVDDVRFGPLPGIPEKVRPVAGRIRVPPKMSAVQTKYSCSLGTDNSNPLKGVKINFRGTVEPEVKGAAYRFDFGDGIQTDWISEPRASHGYRTSATFNAFLVVRIGNEEVRSPVLPIHVVELTLTLGIIGSTHVTLGQPVRFEATLEPPYPGLQYQFQYEDERGRAREWITESTQEHRFAREGAYRVIALARTEEEVILRSNYIAVQVSRAPVTVYSIRLGVEPDRIRVGDPVRFWAILNPEIERAEYQFQFGDGTDTNWYPESGRSHAFQQTGQFPAKVSVRSGGNLIATSPPVIVEVMRLDYKLVLESDRDDPRTDEIVRFRGRIEPEAEVSEYWINFGDGTPSARLSRLQASHAFKVPGLFSVVLSARIGEETFSSEGLNITVRPIPSRVNIEANPTSARPYARIAFRADVQPYNAGIDFQFIYGDDEIRDWSRDPTAVHAYTRSGSYRAFVRVRLNQELLAESMAIPIQIAGSPLILLWGGIGATLILAFGGAAVFRQRRLKERRKRFRAIFRAEPRKDSGDQKIGPESSEKSNYDVRLKPMKDSGEPEIEASGPLVFRERRES